MSSKTNKKKKANKNILIKSEKTLLEIKEHEAKDKFKGYYKTKKRFIN